MDSAQPISRTSGPIVFELCAQDLHACHAARRGGADRIELCSCLDVGGLTPANGLIEAAVEQSGLPIHVLLRPNAEGFHYAADAFEAICRGVLIAREFGAAGVVVGVLHADHKVDIERTRTLVSMAAPMEVTFHRAFDETPDLERALDDVMTAGCHRILTSGGAPDVLRGAKAMARLVQRAQSRVCIAAGRGLRLSNAREVRDISGARHFHGSLLHAEAAGPALLEDRVRAVVQVLNTTWASNGA